MSLAKYQSLITESLKKFIPECRVKSFIALTPDASSRRYFRIELSKAAIERVVAMLFLSTKSPEAGGAVAVSSDRSVIELGKFFNSHSIAVPEIVFEDLDNSLIFIEDLGDLSLAEAFQKNPNLSYYESAIDQILKLQSIKHDGDFFPFKRQFAFEQYRSELNEILDYSLTDLTAIERNSLGVQFDNLSEGLNSLAKVLVHRDFHSWNIMIDYNKKVRVIDYQDALMATRHYDLVALINDRDTDQLLGEENYLSLLKFYFEKFNKPKNFLKEYCIILLQRDLKVVGRFAKLDKIKPGANYSKWIPGTVTRIARTLDYLSGDYSKIADILSSKYPYAFLPAKKFDLRKLEL